MNATLSFRDGLVVNLTWKKRWEELAFASGDQQTVTFTRSQLLEGAKVALPDNSTIEVRLEPKQGLHWTRDGQAFPGPGTPAFIRVQGARAALIGYGIFNVLFGVLGYLLLDLGAIASVLSFGAGALFMIFAFVKNGRSRVAMAASAILMAAVIVERTITSFRMLTEGGIFAIGGVVIVLIFLIAVLRAFPAIRELDTLDLQMIKPSAPTGHTESRP